VRALLVRGWQPIDARLEPARIRFVCVAILILGILLLAISFATADGGLTPFGPPLGADFAGFYNAGAILNQPSSSDRDRLYDIAYQDALYHQLLPRLAEEKKLPFVHPPFVAAFFSGFAQLRYEWAFACWLLISAGLYLAGLLILRRTVLREIPLDWPTALLLALSFEPFVFECWLGGQLSAFGFFCVSAALAFLHLGRPFPAGLAFGALVYKPTLLVLVLPALVIQGRWRTLSGFAISAAVFIAVSYFAAGAANFAQYIEVLSGFTRTAAGTPAVGALELPLWKYVDLNSFLRLLLRASATIHWSLFAAASLPLFLLLFRFWWFSAAGDKDGQQLMWAGLLTATLIVNLYVGIYDAILAAPAILLGIAVSIRRQGTLSPGFRALLLCLYLVPWVTQPIARATGVQIFTIALYAATVFLMAVDHFNAFRVREPAL
jgi:hypothetical protein